MRTVSTIVTLLLVMALCAEAKTIKVPEDFAKIQLAINAAVNGDTVLVAEGTYNENLRLTKKIVVSSYFLIDNDTSHISKTIIDGGSPQNTDSASVFHITTGTDSNTVIMGFTIQNGKGTRMYDAPSSSFWRGGGGINLIAGGATITHNIIQGNVMNSADGVAGGGINIGPYDAPLTYWIIENNRIAKNVINSSVYGAEGGGVWLTEDGRFINNVVESNSAFGYAYSTSGGISIGGSTGYGSTNIELSNNIIRKNSSVWGSALGMFVDPAKAAIPYVLLRNNLIVENTSGNAIHVNSGYYTFINNTIANNGSEYNGIYLERNRGTLSFQLFNNIIWNPAMWNDINSLDYATAYYNCLRGSYPGVGNFSANPNFISDGSYKLSDSSFCIGRGFDSVQFGGAWYAAPKKDIHGNVRANPTGSFPDVGAIEHSSGTARTLPWQPIAIAFMYGGYSRSCIIDFPSKFTEQKKLPVLFSLNGYGGDAPTQRNYQQNHILGDSVGYITVYPEAYNKRWNSGISDNTSWPTPSVNDVGFISTLIDTIITRFSVDTARVYSCGYSNGGFMSLRLASQLSNRIAAVVSVSGVQTNTSAASYSATRNIPVMLIHGTNDKTVPFNGGKTGWYSVDQTVNFWIQKNSCTLPAETLIVPNSNITDNSTIIGYSYKSPKNISQVKLLKVFNGGHEWPGGPAYSGSGVINRDIDANSEIWNFCKQFTLPNTLDDVSTEIISPTKFFLEQNYPNPFNPITTIRYSLPSTANVKLDVYDLLGREIATLVNEEQSAGWKEVQWNASGVSSGIYFYKLTAGSFIDVKKMMVMK
jgi:polyhydroxybutyrate depolymerase